MKGFFAAALALGLLTTLGAQSPGSLPSPVVDPAPGVFSSAVTVTVTAPEGAQVRYRFLESPSSQTFPWTGPVTLDALAGESRSSTLRLTTDLASGEALTQDYRYQIVRATEPAPVVQPVPGFFTGPVSIRATLPEGWTVSDGAGPVSFPLTVDSPPGDSRTTVLSARGPAGASQSWTYVVDRRDQEATTLDVVSPVPGSWGNPQTLVSLFRGVDRVIWSWGDKLDPSTARSYEGPVLLDRPGPQSLTIGGRSQYQYQERPAAS